MTATIPRPAAKRRYWTADEDAIVRAEYGRTAKLELAARLDRTPSAVHGRAGILGLRRPPGARTVWTPERVAILRAEYRRTPTPLLAERLGTTIPGVRHQAAVLGVTGDPARFVWTDELDGLVRELIGQIPGAALAARLNIGETALYRRARRLGIPARQGPATRYARDQQELRRLRALVERDDLDAGPTVRKLRILLAYRLGVLTEAEAAVAAGIPPGRLIVECGREAARGQAEATAAL
jgi:hypothetical protein